ncbi:Glycosyl transferase family 2 [Porphyromonadaceae bacterium KH3CP3RA]|nr:Glycosyl transferase family 2 [Porphyromonadaceae bacterium KH3CP3RA]
MLHKPFVSISCITYNHAPYIRQCLEGFLMQKTNFSFEILIHDDASTDGTQIIIKEYEKKYPNIIKPIYQTENQYSRGVKINPVFNFPRANGKYIAFCEGDDYWTHQYKLQKQVDFLENNPKIVFCSHNINKIDNNNIIIETAKESENILFYSSKEIIHNHFPTLSLVFRNVKLEYTQQLNKAFNGDAVLTTLLSLYGGAAHLGFIGANYRVHTQGIYNRNSYIENTLKSIDTRRILISSSSLPKETSKEIERNIGIRKYKASKYCLKRLKIISLLKILKA